MFLTKYRPSSVDKWFDTDFFPSLGKFFEVEGEGKEVFRKLVKTADVVVENFRPGTLDGWGLGYSELRRDNPRLVWCSITSFACSATRRSRSSRSSMNCSTRSGSATVFRTSSFSCSRYSAICARTLAGSGGCLRLAQDNRVTANMAAPATRMTFETFIATPA